jgi:integrase
VDLVDRLGCSDIRRSLRTSNMRVARQRAWALIVGIEEAFAKIRSSGLPPDSRIALRTVFSHILDELDRDKHSLAGRETCSRLMDLLATPTGADLGNRVPLTLDKPAASPVQVQPVVPLAGPEMAVLINEAVQNAVQGAMQAVMQGAMSDIIQGAVQSAMIDDRARKPFSEFVDAYLEAKKTKVRPKTHYELGVKIRVFLDAMGDQPVHLYTRQTLKDYCTLLEQMPKDAIKHLRTDNLRQAIALNAKRKVPLPTLTSVTIEAKYLSAVRGLFQYLVVERVLKDNPVNFVKVEGNERDEEWRLAVEKRLPFTHDQLRQITAKSQRKSRGTVDFWWAKILPFTGLRLAEFIQLNVADIRQHHGRWCIDLLHTPDGDPVNAERRKQLNNAVKTLAGYRVIPLHKRALDSGFLDFVEERKRRSGELAPLFITEKPDRFGQYGKNASRRLNTAINDVIDDPRYVVHSTRHYFSARCKEVDMPTELRNYFIGHEEDDEGNDAKPIRRSQHVGKIYGGAIPEPSQLAWIDKLVFGP